MKKVIGALLLAGSSMFAGPRVYFGVGVGVPVAPPPPPPVIAYAAPAPGPGYAWVNGYYYPVGPRYVWRPGYWARPPYAGSVWVAPRYHRGHYHRGYWH
jgi:hypothetical protein